MRNNVSIFDSSPLACTGLKNFLTKNGIYVSGCATSTDELFRNIIIDEPGVIIIDPTTMTSISLCLLDKYQKMLEYFEIVIFSASDSGLLIIKNSRLKWMAYVSKSQPLEKLLQVISNPPTHNKVMTERSLSTYTLEKCIHTEINHLTTREMQVLREIGAGKTNKIIASEMSLSSKTISTYKRNIMHKLNTSDIRVVVDFARQMGF